MRVPISLAVLLIVVVVSSNLESTRAEEAEIEACFDEIEKKMFETVEIPEEAKLAAKLLYERNPKFKGQNLFLVVYGYLEGGYELNGLEEFDETKIKVCQKFKSEVFKVMKSSECGPSLVEEIHKIDRDIMAHDYPTWTDTVAHLAICPFSKEETKPLV